MGIALAIAIIISQTASAGAVDPVPPVALGGPGHWVTYADYPVRALQENMQGSVNIRIQISKAGVVTDCIVLESSGSPLLDHTTCKLVTTRARFVPAMDGEGRAVDAAMTHRIHWLIP